MQGHTAKWDSVGRMQAKPGTLNQVFGLISGGDLGSGRLQELQLQARFQASVQGVLGTWPAPALAGARCLGVHSSLGGWGQAGRISLEKSFWETEWHLLCWVSREKVESQRPIVARAILGHMPESPSHHCNPSVLAQPRSHHPSPQTAGPLAGLPVPNCTFPAETQVQPGHLGTLLTSSYLQAKLRHVFMAFKAPVSASNL